MKATAHTPGPWQVVPYGDGDSLVIHAGQDRRVCFMATPGDTPGAMQWITANARLIAAAPEVTDALAGLLTFFSPPGEDSLERFERIAAEFYAETRMLAPGKSEPMEMSYPGRDEERRERYDAWVQARVEAGRAALAKAGAAQ